MSAGSSDTKVVITGLGATTPLGGDMPTTWEALLAGTCGARTIEADWVAKYELPVTFGARVIGVVYREPLLLAAAANEGASISDILDRNIVTQEGDGPLVPLLRRMGESQSRTAVILQGHEVRGVITVDRLIEALRAARD